MTQQTAAVATAKPDYLKAHIRWMIRRDMVEVLQIERDSFEFAWEEEDFLRCLRQRNCIGMVAEVGERVIGFFVYELKKKRVEMLNMAVAPMYRRRGVGMQIIAKLRSKLSSHRRTAILATVRETNLPAQLFFRRMRFLAAPGLLHAHYEDTGEDGIEMWFGDEESEVDERCDCPDEEVPHEDWGRCLRCGKKVQE